MTFLNSNIGEFSWVPEKCCLLGFNFTIFMNFCLSVCVCMHTYSKCHYGKLANAPLKYQVLFNILESQVEHANKGDNARINLHRNLNTTLYLLVPRLFLLYYVINSLIYLVNPKKYKLLKMSWENHFVLNFGRSKPFTT